MAKTIYATHGSCYLEDPELEDYQCMCKFPSGVRVYEYFFLVISILTFLVCSYLLIGIWQIVRKNRQYFIFLKLKILSLSVTLLFSVIGAIYYGYDPHRCERAIDPILESILYGMGICLPGILLVVIILRWIDLLKASFTQQKHALFKPATKRFFFSFMAFWFIFEIFCRVFWAGSTYYIYSSWCCLYTIICFIGFLIIGTKLNRKLLYGAKLSGSIDEKRRSQINQIYKVAVTGSLVCIAIFVESLIAMVISCFNNDKCGLAMEFLWKFEEYVIVWIYIWLAWKGNCNLKNLKKTQKPSVKTKPNLELVEQKSDLEETSSSNFENNSRNNSNSNTNSNSNSDSNTKNPEGSTNSNKPSTISEKSSDSVN
ncbi:zinc finger cchc domain-containing protein [Anaeramoeba flamelloides]|uniref:Zinc finger cchc domain-containing protein n=1 Tax=Anaeramoeba flamelloides TaxID=1746091 RepID=A0AAV7YPU5_9EUKA|nr:zinc finger cchc domain-containing protein [Anaeramoeba flamelloides]